MSAFGKAEGYANRNGAQSGQPVRLASVFFGASRFDAGNIS